MALNWSRDKSITLSQLCLLGFALLLLALDLGAYWLSAWFTGLRQMAAPLNLALMVTVYLCSVFAWPLLWSMWRLLGNLRRELVFVPENVRRLRAVSWCCVGAALLCMLSASYYPSFLLIAVAAGFMCLIVRVVKNVFQQAIAMKSELDLTI